MELTGSRMEPSASGAKVDCAACQGQLDALTAYQVCTCTCGVLLTGQQLLMDCWQKSTWRSRAKVQYKTLTHSPDEKEQPPLFVQCPLPIARGFAASFQFSGSDWLGSEV